MSRLERAEARIAAVLDGDDPSLEMILNALRTASAAEDVDARLRALHDAALHARRLARVIAAICFTIRDETRRQAIAGLQRGSDIDAP